LTPPSCNAHVVTHSEEELYLLEVGLLDVVQAQSQRDENEEPALIYLLVDVFKYYSGIKTHVHFELGNGIQSVVQVP